MRSANKTSHPRYISAAIAIAALFLLGNAATASQPATQPAEKDYILRPPELDYKALCKESGYLTEVEVNQLLAKQNNANLSAVEQFRLGLIYEEGLGNAYSDHAKAKAFFERAIRSKSKYQASGQTHLARLLIRGRGVTLDTKRALELLKQATTNEAYTGGFVLGQYLENDGQYADAEKYYRLAAAEGNPNAVLHLVYMYKKGYVTPDNPQTIDDYFAYAQNIMLERINKGQCTALYRFGKLYILERLVDRNEVVAAQWLSAAAKAGHVRAMLDLATLYRKGVGVEYNQEQAFTLWRRAAAKGAKDAMYELGFAYALGDGVEKNFDTSTKWLEQAAERRHLKATIMLADIYDGEYGEEYIDKKKALEWLLMAAKDPLVKSSVSYRIGLAYKYGRGVEIDLKKAFAFFERSAKDSNKDAAQEVANAYRFGWGVKQQPIKSLRFTRLASTWGNDKSSYYMATHQKCGIGVEKNPEKAILWVDRAVAQGNAEAILSYDKFLINATTEQRATTKLGNLKKAANNEISKAMTLLAIVEAQHDNEDAVTKLINDAMEIGDAPAEIYLVLGRAYLKGDGLLQNSALGIKHLETAVNYGSDSALFELSKYKFKQDTLTYEDITRLEKNVLRDHKDSIYLLGEIYESPTFYDAQKSTHYYQLAALHGSVDAMLTLAMQEKPSIDNTPWLTKAKNASLCKDSNLLRASEYYYFKGDVQASAQYLESAANNGNSKAMRYLAELYNDPGHALYDHMKAKSWAQKAADLGDNDAASMLTYFATAYH